MRTRPRLLPVEAAVSTFAPWSSKMTSGIYAAGSPFQSCSRGCARAAGCDGVRPVGFPCDTTTIDGQQAVVLRSCKTGIAPPAHGADVTWTSDDLPPDFRGGWGGVLVLGHAPINTAANLPAIEGVPPTAFRNVYGGDDPDDSSGTLRYVPIRHRGTIVGGTRYFLCVTSYHPRNINRRDGNGAPVSRVRVVVCS